MRLTIAAYFAPYLSQTGLTASWNPQQTTGGSALTLSASQSAASGTYALSVVGSGDGLERSASLSVEIVAPVTKSAAGCTSSGTPGFGAAMLGCALLARIRGRSRLRRSKSVG